MATVREALQRDAKRHRRDAERILRRAPWDARLGWVIIGLLLAGAAWFFDTNFWLAVAMVGAAGLLWAHYLADGQVQKDAKRRAARRIEQAKEAEYKLATWRDHWLDVEAD